MRAIDAAATGREGKSSAGVLDQHTGGAARALRALRLCSLMTLLAVTAGHCWSLLVNCSSLALHWLSLGAGRYGKSKASSSFCNLGFKLFEGLA